MFPPPQEGEASSFFGLTAVRAEDRFQSVAEFQDAIENQLVMDVSVAGQTAPA